jgi:hypothetical protein
MMLLSENIHIKKQTYFRFILVRGLETITTVFRMILFFTRNMSLVKYHTQKAFYFYIEFIEQISDVQNSFLQLSSRDAVLFVYKKTLFDINHEFKKQIKPENTDRSTFELLDKYLNINGTLITFYLHHPECTYETKNVFIRKCCDNLKTYNKNIIDAFKPNSVQIQIIECINNLVDKMYTVEINKYQSMKNISDILAKFITTISKNTNTNTLNELITKITTKEELETFVQD